MSTPACKVGEILDPSTNKCFPLNTTRGKEVFNKLYNETPLTEFFNKFILNSAFEKPWRGTEINEIIAMLYLIEKHENDCVILPIPPKGKNLRSVRFEDYALTWKIASERKRGRIGKLSIPRRFAYYLKQCAANPKVRFIVIPLGLEITNEDSGHANYLIIDKKLKTVEHFEPHGGRSFIEREFDISQLETVLTDYFKKFGYTYLPPRKVCPNIGIQSIQEKYRQRLKKIDPSGYCLAWSILYADLRLSYPDIPPLLLQDLILDSFSNMPQLLLLTIRNYTQYFRAQSSNLLLEETREKQRQYLLKKLYTAQKVKPLSCPTGKERSPKSGRCVNKCKSNQIRNPLTGRCKKKVKDIKSCPRGKEISPKSGRCVKKCKSNQIRNPKTGRCRKVSVTYKKRKL